MAFGVTSGVTFRRHVRLTPLGGPTPTGVRGQADVLEPNPEGALAVKKAGPPSVAFRVGGARDGSPLTIAGLWDEWKNIEIGEPPQVMHIDSHQRQ